MLLQLPLVWHRLRRSEVRHTRFVLSSTSFAARGTMWTIGPGPIRGM
jgi:hypothetical protein